MDPETVKRLKRGRRERGTLALQLVQDDALIFGTLEVGHLHLVRFSRVFVGKQAQARRTSPRP